LRLDPPFRTLSAVRGGQRGAAMPKVGDVLDCLGETIVREAHAGGA
jgi:hypothetical protein